MTLQPRLTQKPAFTVVGMLLHMKGMSPEIPALWERFAPRMSEIQYQSEPHVSCGLMDHFDQQAGTLDYVAGNAVAQVTQLPPGMTRWDVPANTYIVFEAVLPKIGETFGYFCNTWLPSSGYQQTAAPYFERYGETFSPENPMVEIYIPVEKKS